ncbi:MAG: FAD-dependent oxidoreductase [Desulfobacterales bacterium]|jgi:aspartate oxidase
MEHIECDVLVVGSGAAGLRAAISAKQKGLDVCVISKQAPGKATCTMLSAGVFAGTEEGKSSDHHSKSTLQAGRGINQKELVNVLAEEGPMRLQELNKWGINAAFRHGYLYCKGRAPYRGREIVKCLLTKNEAIGTRFISGQMVAELKQPVGLPHYTFVMIILSECWVTVMCWPMELALFFRILSLFSFILWDWPNPGCLPFWCLRI